MLVLDVPYYISNIKSITWDFSASKVRAPCFVEPEKKLRNVFELTTIALN